MNTEYNTLRTSREWRSVIGLSKKQFEVLAEAFDNAHINIFGKSFETRVEDRPVKGRFDNSKELLFFLLFSLKTNLGQDALGFIYGINGSNVNRNKQLGLRILRAALIDLEVMPKREFHTVREFESYLHKYDVLLLDGTEHRIQRPGNQDVEKSFYSGKKNVTQ